MRLTRFTDYSLRTLIYLGMNTGNRVTIGEISEVYDISKNHLMKVVSNLTRIGVVAAQRGPGGGIRLNRPAVEINLDEIIRHTEKNLRARGGAGTAPGADKDARLQDCLNLALEAYLGVLERFTLEDLLCGGEPRGELATLEEQAA